MHLSIGPCVSASSLLCYLHQLFEPSSLYTCCCSVVRVDLSTLFTLWLIECARTYWKLIGDTLYLVVRESVPGVWSPCFHCDIVIISGILVSTDCSTSVSLDQFIWSYLYLTFIYIIVKNLFVFKLLTIIYINNKTRKEKLLYFFAVYIYKCWLLWLAVFNLN